MEDDDAVRAVVARQLERRGYRTLLAASLATAHARLEAEAVDLVLSDVDLPDGSGFELLARLRSERPELAVLLMTGGSAVARPHGASPEPVLRKPLDFEELARRVEQAL